MPQIENKELLGKLLRATIVVIGRRTSEAYANVIISSTVKNLSVKYEFLTYVNIIGGHQNEVFDTIEIKEEINDINTEEIGKASLDFMKSIIRSMGKEAGFYFIREIKEDLPYDYERSIKDLGVDFDFLQLDFITDVKQNIKAEARNDEILHYMLTFLFEILERDSGRKYAYETLNELTTRLCIEHEALKYVKINNMAAAQNLEVVEVDKSVNDLAPSSVGSCVQKILQDLFNSYDEVKGFAFIDKVKKLMNTTYESKLRNIGVDVSVIKLRQENVVKHVLKTLIDLLADASSQNYAILMVGNIVKQHSNQFDYLGKIKFDSSKYLQDEGIILPENIESIRPSEIGRGLQRIIENISTAMGEDSGEDFVSRFKRRLGKAYLLRIEELGVNLHMIELRNNLLF